MTESWVLVGLSPFFAVVVVFGVIVVVALCQAETTDVPTVFRDSLSILQRLIEHMPMITRMDDEVPEDEDEDDVPFNVVEADTDDVDEAVNE